MPPAAAWRETRRNALLALLLVTGSESVPWPLTEQGGFTRRPLSEAPGGRAVEGPSRGFSREGNAPTDVPHNDAAAGRTPLLKETKRDRLTEIAFWFLSIRSVPPAAAWRETQRNALLAFLLVTGSESVPWPLHGTRRVHPPSPERSARRARSRRAEPRLQPRGLTPRRPPFSARRPLT
jgi:hypothetical protein